mmetsp:Transcript_29924/g.95362  ORF Transcript_29924/g.95362 Transcript_29924/m.95362 type:complete len:577 (-) Transcript_29924:82-1812(-)
MVGGAEHGLGDGLGGRGDAVLLLLLLLVHFGDGQLAHGPRWAVPGSGRCSRRSRHGRCGSVRCGCSPAPRVGRLADRHLLLALVAILLNDERSHPGRSHADGRDSPHGRGCRAIGRGQLLEPAFGEALAVAPLGDRQPAPLLPRVLFWAGVLFWCSVLLLAEGQTGHLGHEVQHLARLLHGLGVDERAGGVGPLPLGPGGALHLLPVRRLPLSPQLLQQGRRRLDLGLVIGVVAAVPVNLLDQELAARTRGTGRTRLGSRALPACRRCPLRCLSHLAFALDGSAAPVLVCFLVVRLSREDHVQVRKGGRRLVQPATSDPAAEVGLGIPIIQLYGGVRVRDGQLVPSQLQVAHGAIGKDGRIRAVKPKRVRVAPHRPVVVASLVVLVALSLLVERPTLHLHLRHVAQHFGRQTGRETIVLARPTAAAAAAAGVRLLVELLQLAIDVEAVPLGKVLIGVLAVRRLAAHPILRHRAVGVVAHAEAARLVDVARAGAGKRGRCDERRWSGRPGAEWRPDRRRLVVVPDGCGVLERRRQRLGGGQLLLERRVRRRPPHALLTADRQRRRAAPRRGRGRLAQ